MYEYLRKCSLCFLFFSLNVETRIVSQNLKIAVLKKILPPANLTLLFHINVLLFVAQGRHYQTKNILNILLIL